MQQSARTTLRVLRPFRGLPATACFLAGMVGFGGITAVGVADPQGPVWLVALTSLMVAIFGVALVQVWNRRILVEEDRIGVASGWGRGGAWTRFEDIVGVSSRLGRAQGKTPQMSLQLIASAGGHRLSRNRGGRASLDLPLSELREQESQKLIEVLRARVPIAARAEFEQEITAQRSRLSD